MLASKGRVPVTIPAHPLDRKRLWLVSFVSVVAILAVNYIVSGPAHVGSPIVVRLAAAAVVTAFVAVANAVAGPRAAAATAVVGVLIAVVVLTRPA
jgi:Na+-translocating ferredoxin:NAD+ oxidoreductase RnfD subunit